MSHVWPPPALDGWPERAKMAPHHNPICVTSVWVRWIPKVSITVVLTTKRVTEKAKKWGKMAILWQFLSHRGSLMAPRHLQLEYPLAPMIWSALEHFRVSGSTPTWQLLCSFTEAIRVASPFIHVAYCTWDLHFWYPYIQTLSSCMVYQILIFLRNCVFLYFYICVCMYGASEHHFWHSCTKRFSKKIHGPNLLHKFFPGARFAVLNSTKYRTNALQETYCRFEVGCFLSPIGHSEDEDGQSLYFWKMNQGYDWYQIRKRFWISLFVSFGMCAQMTSKEKKNIGKI